MAQSYYIRDYIDLYHFCGLLQGFCKQLPASVEQDEVRNACDAVLRAIDKNFVLKAGYNSDQLKNSYGISIYFPSISPCYVSLDFAKTTRWHEFLHDYVGNSLQLNRVADNKDNEGTYRRVNSPMMMQQALPPTTNGNTRKERLMEDIGKMEDNPEKMAEIFARALLEAFKSLSSPKAEDGRSDRKGAVENAGAEKDEPAKEVVFEVRVKLVSPK
jgi:hypothetical protein